ncbi:MAG: 16S rRNA (cytosine(1402)-N(4))-methyltransferase RsmH [Planctomycetota bacterium]
MADEPHRPVMLDEVCEFLRPAPGQCTLDCTVGAGGHAEKILALSQPDGKLIGLDRDPAALAAAAGKLAKFGGQAVLVHACFADAANVLAENGIEKVHNVIFDLGLSSIQLDAPGRGFSFRHEDAPLDMRADPTAGKTAAELLARVTEVELADVLWRLADERRSRRIARAICAERRKAPIETAGRLAAIVARAAGGRWRRIHPATRTFMAIRMWVNRELPNLEEALTSVRDIVEPGGRVVVISFHSKEDRIAKTVFRSQARDGVWRILTKRPLVAADDEVRRNPRARSAKLRAVEREDVV